MKVKKSGSSTGAAAAGAGRGGAELGLPPARRLAHTLRSRPGGRGHAYVWGRRSRLEAGENDPGLGALSGLEHEVEGFWGRRRGGRSRCAASF